MLIVWGTLLHPSILQMMMTSAEAGEARRGGKVHYIYTYIHTYIH